MYLIKRRLESEYGLRVLLFNYPSVRGTLDENAAALSKFIHQQGFDDVHILGHSLGGVLALRSLANDLHALPGRVVCIGSPLTGSRAAKILSDFQWAQDILGKSLSDGVIHRSANEWATSVAQQHDIGVIAGNLPFGFGRFVADFREDNDGTIAVSETRLDGAKDHLVLRVSHKGMLVSPEVVDQAAAFFKRGEFLR